MANYIDYTNGELLEILSKYDSLTFIAKIELKNELVKRNMDKGTEDFKRLEKLISQEIEEVKTFKFLSDIGFDVNWFNDNKSFEITRSVKATLIDLTAIFLGLFFSIIGIIGLSLLLSSVSSNVPFSITWAIFSIVLLIIGFFGFRMLYGGINRIIEYNGFKFIINQGDMILRKRFDFKIKEIEEETSSLNIKRNGKGMSLMIGDLEIITASSPSFRAKMTLEEIVARVSPSATGSRD